VIPTGKMELVKNIHSFTPYPSLSPVVSLLLNLEAARQGRSVLFSDEQKLLFKGGKKGFVMNTKLDFMSCQLNLE
jgi:hypothetical protein